jgi:hypothetical protein
MPINANNYNTVRVLIKHNTILLILMFCARRLDGITVCIILLCISVPLIRVGPPGHFTHISITTPIVSALKNYYT